MSNPSLAKNTPRYISREKIAEYSRKESEWQIDRIGQFACLLHYREMSIYRDLEKIQDYEISNTYAYELALRTNSFKDELSVYLAKEKREKDARSLATYCYEFRQKFLIDPQECIDFEYGLEFKETRKNNLGKQINEQDVFVRPKFSRPKLYTPDSENMSQILINLSLDLSEQELVSLIKAYKEGYENFKQKRPLIFGNHKKLIVECFNSQSKLVRSKNKLLGLHKEIVLMLEKPNARKLNMLEKLFTYDMVSIGYAPSNIAEALQYSRGQLLYAMNQEFLQKNKIDIDEVIEDITPVVEESTINNNFEEIKKIIDEEMYRSFFVIKSTPEF